MYKKEQSRSPASRNVRQPHLRCRSISWNVEIPIYRWFGMRPTLQAAHSWTGGCHPIDPRLRHLPLPFRRRRRSWVTGWSCSRRPHPPQNRCKSRWTSEAWMGTTSSTRRRLRRRRRRRRGRGTRMLKRRPLGRDTRR